MSESRNKEHMNSIFQASKLRGLAEPEPGVDPCGNFTLTWFAGSTEIVVSFTPAIYLIVTNGIATIRYGCAVKTDSEVIDRVEQELTKAAS